MADCVNCKYAKWERTTNGRLHPSGDGKCAYPLKEQSLPAAFYYIDKPSIGGGYINRKKGLKKGCPFFYYGAN